MDKALNILLLFDVPSANQMTATETRKLLSSHKDYRDERDVLQSLERLGHRVIPLGLFDDIGPLLAITQSESIDVVFPMFETFADERAGASYLTGLLQMAGLPFTGADSSALSVCQDKGLSKIILRHHGIRVPDFCIINRQSTDWERLSAMPYPVIVKPQALDASEGISPASVAHSTPTAIKRIHKLQRDYNCDVIVEEYIDGRELYVGILGGSTITILPPQELFFANKNMKAPRVLTANLKWNKKMRLRHKITSGKPKSLPQKLEQELETTSRKIAEILKLRGYARIDYRASRDGKLYFIEANPNPAIKRQDDFSQSARRAGIEYDDLIARIIDIAQTKGGPLEKKKAA